MFKNYFKLLVCLGAFAASMMLSSKQLSAQTWNGTVSSDWNTPGNWTPAVVPNSAVAVANIPTTATNNIVIPANVSLSSLNISDGMTVNIATVAKLSISGGLSIGATGNLQGLGQGAVLNFNPAANTNTNVSKTGGGDITMQTFEFSGLGGVYPTSGTNFVASPTANLTAVAFTTINASIDLSDGALGSKFTINNGGFITAVGGNRISQVRNGGSIVTSGTVIINGNTFLTTSGGNFGNPAVVGTGDLQINANLQINTGSFNIGNNVLRLGGDLTNNDFAASSNALGTYARVEFNAGSINQTYNAPNAPASSLNLALLRVNKGQGDVVLSGNVNLAFTTTGYGSPMTTAQLTLLEFVSSAGNVQVASARSLNFLTTGVAIRQNAAVAAGNSGKVTGLGTVNVGNATNTVTLMLGSDIAFENSVLKIGAGATAATRSNIDLGFFTGQKLYVGSATLTADGFITTSTGADGSVVFYSAGNQTVNASANTFTSVQFPNLVVSKSSGNVNLSGGVTNFVINGSNPAGNPMTFVSVGTTASNVFLPLGTTNANNAGNLMLGANTFLTIAANGTWTQQGGKIDGDGTGAVFVSGTQFLTVSQLVAGTSQQFVIGNVDLIFGNAMLNLQGNTLALGGSLTSNVPAGTSPSFITTTAFANTGVLFNGTGTQYINRVSTTVTTSGVTAAGMITALPNVEVNKTAGAVFLTTNLIVYGNAGTTPSSAAKLTAGTLDLRNNFLTVTGNNTSLTVGATGILQNTITGTFTSASGGLFISGADYTAGTTPSFVSVVVPGGAIDLGNNVNLVVGQNSGLHLGSNNLTLRGNITNLSPSSSVFQTATGWAGTKTITIDDNTPKTFITVTGNVDFPQLTIAKVANSTLSVGCGTMATPLTNGVVVSNFITIGGSTGTVLDMGASGVLINDGKNVGGIYFSTIDGGTIKFPAAPSAGNVSSFISGLNVFVSSNKDVTGEMALISADLTIATGKTLTLPTAGTLSLGGGLTGGSIGGATGTVKFIGGNNQAINIPALPNVVIEKCINGLFVTVTQASNLSVTSLTVNNGVFAMTTAGSNTSPVNLFISGNLTVAAGSSATKTLGANNAYITAFHSASTVNFATGNVAGTPVSIITKTGGGIVDLPRMFVSANGNVRLATGTTVELYGGDATAANYTLAFTSGGNLDLNGGTLRFSSANQASNIQPIFQTALQALGQSQIIGTGTVEVKNGNFISVGSPTFSIQTGSVLLTSGGIQLNSNELRVGGNFNNNTAFTTAFITTTTTDPGLLTFITGAGTGHQIGSFTTSTAALAIPRLKVESGTVNLNFATTNGSLNLNNYGANNSFQTVLALVGGSLNLGADYFLSANFSQAGQVYGYTGFSVMGGSVARSQAGGANVFFDEGLAFPAGLGAGTSVLIGPYLPGNADSKYGFTSVFQIDQAGLELRSPTNGGLLKVVGDNTLKLGGSLVRRDGVGHNITTFNFNGLTATGTQGAPFGRVEFFGTNFATVFAGTGTTPGGDIIFGSDFVMSKNADLYVNTSAGNGIYFYGPRQTFAQTGSGNFVNSGTPIEVRTSRVDGSQTLSQTGTGIITGAAGRYFNINNIVGGYARSKFITVTSPTFTIQDMDFAVSGDLNTAGNQARVVLNGNKLRLGGAIFLMNHAGDDATALNTTLDNATFMAGGTCALSVNGSTVEFYGTRSQSIQAGAGAFQVTFPRLLINKTGGNLTQNISAVRLYGSTGNILDMNTAYVLGANSYITVTKCDPAQPDAALIQRTTNALTEVVSSTTGRSGIYFQQNAAVDLTANNFLVDDGHVVIANDKTVSTIGSNSLRIGGHLTSVNNAGVATASIETVLAGAKITGDGTVEMMTATAGLQFHSIGGIASMPRLKINVANGTTVFATAVVTGSLAAGTKLTAADNAVSSTLQLEKGFLIFANELENNANTGNTLELTTAGGNVKNNSVVNFMFATVGNVKFSGNGGDQSILGNATMFPAIEVAKTAGTNVIINAGTANTTSKSDVSLNYNANVLITASPVVNNATLKVSGGNLDLNGRRVDLSRNAFMAEDLAGNNVIKDATQGFGTLFVSAWGVDVNGLAQNGGVGGSRLYLQAAGAAEMVTVDVYRKHGLINEPSTSMTTVTINRAYFVSVRGTDFAAGSIPTTRIEYASSELNGLTATNLALSSFFTGATVPNGKYVPSAGANGTTFPVNNAFTNVDAVEKGFTKNWLTVGGKVVSIYPYFVSVPNPNDSNPNIVEDGLRTGIYRGGYKLTYPFTAAATQVGLQIDPTTEFGNTVGRASVLYGVDYTLTGNGLAMAAGNQFLTITLPANTFETFISVLPIEDNIVEGLQPVQLRLLNASAGYVINPNPMFQSASINIIDNDCPAITADFTLARNGGVATFISVGEREVGQTRLDDVIGYKLMKQPSAPVTVVVTSNNAGNTTSAGALLGFNGLTGAAASVELTFTTANWATTQFLTVVAQNDLVFQANAAGNLGRNYTEFTVSTAVKAGSAPEYINPLSVAAFNGCTDPNPTPVVVRNQDNETAVGLKVTRVPLNNTIVEGSTTLNNDQVLVFSVTLDAQPIDNVTLRGVPTGLCPDALITASLNTVTFTPADYATPKFVTVTSPRDNIALSNQFFFSIDFVTVGAFNTPVKLNTLTSANNGLALIQVVNIDQAGVSLTRASNVVNETGTVTTTFGVRLASKPQVNVSVPVAVKTQTGFAAAATLSTNSLVFTPANWNIVQNVTVTGKDDNAKSGDRIFEVVVGSITGGTGTGDCNDKYSPALSNYTLNAFALAPATTQSLFFNLTDNGATNTGGGTVVVTTPATVSGLTASPGSGSVLLTWAPLAETGVSYEVYVITLGGGRKLVGTVTSTSFNVTGLDNGTTYNFQIRAVRLKADGSYNGDPGAYSAAVTARPSIVNGVEDFNFSESFKVYPNPSNGTFTIRFDGVSKFVNVKIANIAGQQVYDREFGSVSGDFQTEIVMDEMPAGMYLLNVNTDKGIFRTKLVFTNNR